MNGKMNHFFRFVGVILVLAIGNFLVVGSLGADAKVFVSFYAFLLVWGGTAGVILMTYGFSAWRSFFMFVTFRGYLLGPESREELTKVFLTARRASMIMGILGILLGMFGLLWFNGLANIDKFGKGLALGMIPIFYAIILSEIILTPMSRILSEEPKQTAHA
jgi:flagellar motor component MotA